MELRHLRHLMAIVEHGSFSRAAEAVHLTQSALSRSIQALEAEQAGIAARLSEGSIYSSAPQEAQSLQQRLETIEAELMAALERWEALESRQA